MKHLLLLLVLALIAACTPPVIEEEDIFILGDETIAPRGWVECVEEGRCQH